MLFYGGQHVDEQIALEQLSGSGIKTKRQASAHEVKWLSSLVAVYGDDVEAMARDVKRNIWQKTGGELRRAWVQFFFLFYRMFTFFRRAGSKRLVVLKSCGMWDTVPEGLIVYKEFFY